MSIIFTVLEILNELAQWVVLITLSRHLAGIIRFMDDSLSMFAGRNKKDE